MMSTQRDVRLFVGTAQGLYEFGVHEGRHFTGHAVTALTSHGPRWWVLVDGRTIWCSAGDGSWEEVVSLPTTSGTCLALTTAGLLVGTAGAHLLRLEGGRIVPVEGLEHVKGREEWHTPWGEPPETRSISTDQGGAVYVNVHVGGVVRSTDGGCSWHPTVDIDADVHQVLAHPAHARVVFAAAAIGLGISTDGGDSWKFEHQGLHARYLRAVAVAGERVLISASSGPGGKRAALYRRRLAPEEPFERCRQGLPEWFASNIDTCCLVASGPTAAFGTDEGLVFLSTDAGASWQTVANSLPAVQCLSVA